MRNRPSRILIADDISGVRQLTREAIESNSSLPFLKNAHFYEASSALEAIQLARAHDPDVCVLDLKYGDAGGVDTGYALIRTISKVCNAAIIVFSDEDDAASLPHALECGADEYVEKKTLLDSRRQLLAFRVDQSVQKNLENRADSIDIDSRNFRYLLGNYQFQLGSRELISENHKIKLTLLEYTLIKVLCSLGFEPADELELYLELYGEAPKPEDKRLQNMLSRLRKKLDGSFDIGADGSSTYCVKGKWSRLASTTPNPASP